MRYQRLMRWWHAMVMVSLLIMGTVIVADADIVKLKRGVSFEGRVLEEKNDGYVVEMNVGVVQFKKDEVASVEYYSDSDNEQMAGEWHAAPAAATGEAAAGETSAAASSAIAAIAATSTATQVDDNSLITNPPAEGAASSSSSEELIKYKGKYVTPEVYKIIQREREIKERRERFLEEQERRKAEDERVKKLRERQQAEEQKRQELASSQGSQQSQGTVMGSSSVSTERLFGSTSGTNSSSPYRVISKKSLEDLKNGVDTNNTNSTTGSSGNVSEDMAKYGFKRFGGKTYGTSSTAASSNTI